MMNFNEFKEEIVKALSNVFENTEISINTVTKNNGLTLDGLIIFSPTSNISPTIYVNHYFEQYASGRDIDDIVNDIADVYTDSLPKTNFDIQSFTDWERVRGNIIYCLVNREKNAELLEKVPHREFLDLAIIYKCLVSNFDTDGCATIQIRNEHLEFWNVSESDLFTVASENTPKKFKADLKDICSTLSGMMDSDMDIDLSPAPMFVLSNTSKLNGATVILYNNVLKKFADMIKSDLYILPSSVHETILLPSFEGMSKDELKEMVECVNATQVAPHEVLSDNVYFYDRAKDEISL